MTDRCLCIIDDDGEELPDPDCVMCGGTGNWPEGMDLCLACDGSGGSGEFEERYAPATWDDPGYYECEELPCRFCGGKGVVPKRQRPELSPVVAFKPVVIDDETPF